MRRLSRILRNAATAVSLVLCVATVLLWVRSTRWTDAIEWYAPASHVRILNRRAILVAEVIIPNDSPGRKELTVWSDPGPSDTADWTPYRREPRGKGHFTRLCAPWWFVFIVTAFAPVAFLVRQFRRRDRRPGLCPACGYDLRATPDRCPECGTPTQIATATGSAADLESLPRHKASPPPS